MNKPLIRELAWLLLAVIITFLLAVVRFGWGFSSRNIDISLSDTYFVASAEILLIPMFSIVCFLLFFFKEINRHISRTIPSVITIASGILLIAMLTMTTKFLPVIAGWTTYPPLSALEGGTKLNYGFDENFNALANIIIAIQVIVAIMTIYVAYRLGVAKIKKISLQAN